MQSDEPHTGLIDLTLHLPSGNHLSKYHDHMHLETSLQNSHIYQLTSKEGYVPPKSPTYTAQELLS